MSHRMLGFTLNNLATKSVLEAALSLHTLAQSYEFNSFWSICGYLATLQLTFCTLSETCTNEVMMSVFCFVATIDENNWHLCSQPELNVLWRMVCQFIGNHSNIAEFFTAYVPIAVEYVSSPTQEKNINNYHYIG